ncbi:MAG TPA: hypothetical protein VFU01_14090 [Gemmatimonadaceae bacterium]|nr:hypothetical protein [Gemmatimonadaceae bacterium]
MRTVRLVIPSLTIVALTSSLGCASRQRSEGVPHLASVLMTLMRAPKSVAAFELVQASALTNGGGSYSYASLGDSTIRASVLVQAIGARATQRTPSELVALSRAYADSALAGDRLTADERRDVSFRIADTTIYGHYVLSRPAQKASIVHHYAIVVGPHLVRVHGEHPRERDAAGAIEQFVEAFADSARRWIDSESASPPVAAGSIIPPRRLGAFELVDTHVYPIASLGTQYRYRDSTGFQPDVYVYPGNLAEHGTDTLGALREEAREFVETLPHGRARGYYQSYRVLADTVLTVPLPRGDRVVHRITLAMKRDGADQDSYFYVTAIGREFVKVRVTQPRGTVPAARVDAFVQELLAGLGR